MSGDFFYPPGGAPPFPPPPESGDHSISEKQYALETLERYAGCSHKLFQPNMILTNFPHYVDAFAGMYDIEVFEGSMFKVAHDKKNQITMLDFKIGSPAAALVVDLCSFLNLRANLVLGMCGGLRRRYKIGEYLLPVACIRDEGTSDYYFPPEVPALSNFLMSRATTEVLEQEKIDYHIGISFSTNKRFWEFNEDFKDRLKASKAQAIEMECATLFVSGYRRKIHLGALLLISDLPLNRDGMKTKKAAEFVFEKYMTSHIELGVKIIEHAGEMLDRKTKGQYNIKKVPVKKVKGKDSKLT